MEIDCLHMAWNLCLASYDPRPHSPGHQDLTPSAWHSLQQSDFVKGRFISFSETLRDWESRNTYWSTKSPNKAQIYHKNSRPIFVCAIPAELISGKRSKLFYTSKVSPSHLRFHMRLQDIWIVAWTSLTLQESIFHVLLTSNFENSTFLLMSYSKTKVRMREISIYLLLSFFWLWKLEVFHWRTIFGSASAMK